MDPVSPPILAHFYARFYDYYSLKGRYLSHMAGYSRAQPCHLGQKPWWQAVNLRKLCCRPGQVSSGSHFLQIDARMSFACRPSASNLSIKWRPSLANLRSFSAWAWAWRRQVSSLTPRSAVADVDHTLIAITTGDATIPFDGRQRCSRRLPWTAPDSKASSNSTIANTNLSRCETAYWPKTRPAPTIDSVH